jgi:hypothetical protein
LDFALLVDDGNFVAVSGDLLLFHDNPTSRLHYGVAAASGTTVCYGTVTNDSTGCRATALICGTATTALSPGRAC